MILQRGYTEMLQMMGWGI